MKNTNTANFIDTFLLNRTINYEFYCLVPATSFDFKMTVTSDSVKKSLAHQIWVCNQYIRAIKTGKLEFHSHQEEAVLFNSKNKDELLTMFREQNEEITQLLEGGKSIELQCSVPWSRTQIGVINMLDGLKSHEILHTGWNLAVMDHLGISRYPQLKKMWG